MMIRRVTRDAIAIGDRSYTETIALTSEAILEDFVPAPIAELEQRPGQSLSRELTQILYVQRLAREVSQ